MRPGLGPNGNRDSNMNAQRVGIRAKRNQSLSARVSGSQCTNDGIGPVHYILSPNTKDRGDGALPMGSTIQDN